MAECRVLTASHAGRFRTVYWPRAGFEHIGAIKASREPSPDLYSEAMMIGPVSRDGIHGPGFRCHGSPMCSQSGDHLVFIWLRARLRLKARPSVTVP